MYSYEEVVMGSSSMRVREFERDTKVERFVNRRLFFVIDSMHSSQCDEKRAI